ncbi:MAG: NusG domain II-containing protein, partial [Candidatus Cloacimonadaceae bacterium]|nr:NusG domain II-containing protein [Candidatus Cloacimonadaceae bacterium]
AYFDAPLVPAPSMADSLIKNIRKTITMADVLLIIVILSAIILSGIRIHKNRNQLHVFVYKDNILVGSYPLDKDRTVVIDEHNTIQIRNRKVRMISADCPDKRCIKQGDTQTMPIICVPNHLIVEIKKNHAEPSKFILY